MAQTRSIASPGGATLQDAVASVDAAHTVAPKAFTPLDAHAHEERRLFIGGLPPKATEKSVVDRFDAFPTLAVSDVYVSRMVAGDWQSESKRFGYATVAGSHFEI